MPKPLSLIENYAMIGINTIKKGKRIKNMVQSPISYMGNKRRLLQQILPLLPDSCDSFVDLFCGSCNVGINYPNAKKYLFNDNLNLLIDMYRKIQLIGLENTLKTIEKIIEENNLSKYGKEEFYAYRKKVNQYSTEPLDLFVLNCFSFNNQIRYNKSMKYNSPFGQREFNDHTRENLKNFCNFLKNHYCEFSCCDFYELLDIIVSLKNCLVYIDPPYLGSDTPYNNTWGLKEESKMYDFCIKLHESKVKFALSNNLQMNQYLKEHAFFKRFNVHYLNIDYKNCFYTRGKKEQHSQEILITNY